MVSEYELNKLRRLRVLQILKRVTPDPMGELALLSALKADKELSPTVERVRQSLSYLHFVGFIELLKVPDSGWMAGVISDTGQLFLEDNTGDNKDDRLFVGIDGKPPEIYLPADKPQAVDDNYRGRVSAIEMLPIEVKSWLDQELIRLNFTSYRDLAGNLKEQGYKISKSSVGRYGKRFKAQQKHLRESIRQAKMLAEEVGGDGAAMNQALTALAQDKLMGILHDEAFDDFIKLPDLVRSIASLNRSDINTRKFQIVQQAKEQAAKDAVKSMIKQGVNQEAIDQIKNDILGIK